MARPTNNQKFLRDYMTRHKLTRPDIAKALCVNLSTVDRWLVPPSSISHRRMPEMAKKLLTYMEQKGEFAK